MWSLHQGEHSNFFRNTFEAPRGINTQHAISYKAVMPHPAQRSREVTLNNSEGHRPTSPPTATGRASRVVKSGTREHHGRQKWHEAQLNLYT
jgi:hypothetical protein